MQNTFFKISNNQFYNYANGHLYIHSDFNEPVGSYGDLPINIKKEQKE